MQCQNRAGNLRQLLSAEEAPADPCSLPHSVASFQLVTFSVRKGKEVLRTATVLYKLLYLRSVRLCSQKLFPALEMLLRLLMKTSTSENSQPGGLIQRSHAWDVCFNHSDLLMFPESFVAAHLH